LIPLALKAPSPSIEASVPLEAVGGGFGLRAPVVDQVLPLPSRELRTERLSKLFERVFVYYFFPLRLDAAAAGLFLGLLGGVFGFVLSGLCRRLGFARTCSRFGCPVYGRAVGFVRKRPFALRL